MTIEHLFTAEQQWLTRMGKVFPKEKVVFRNKDLHQELKDLSWFELYLYGITGRQFNTEQLKVLNYIWVNTSYPDPRIWNNRIAALGGTVRTHAASAMAAAIGASDATLYGGRPFIKGVECFYRLKNIIRSGQCLEVFIEDMLKHKETIYGYGRAFEQEDERIPHMLKFLKQYDMDKGVCVKLALDIEKILNKKKKVSMNISALYCALAVDFGFSSEEFYWFMTLVFTAGMMPCYIDAVQKPVGLFFPIRCERLIYRGHQQRRRLDKKDFKERGRYERMLTEPN